MVGGADLAKDNPENVVVKVCTGEAQGRKPERALDSRDTHVAPES